MGPELMRQLGAAGRFKILVTYRENNQIHVEDDGNQFSQCRESATNMEKVKVRMNLEVFDLELEIPV